MPQRNWSNGSGLRLDPVEEEEEVVGRLASTARRRSSGGSSASSHEHMEGSWATGRRYSSGGHGETRRSRRRPSIGNEPKAHAASRMAPEMVMRLRQYEQDDQALRAAAVRELREWFQRQERRHCPNEVAKRALVATRFAGPDDLGAAYRWVVQNIDELEGQAKAASSSWGPVWRWICDMLEPWEPAPKLDRENYRLWATERLTQQFWDEFPDETERWGGPWVVKYTLGLEERDFETDDKYVYVNLISQSGEVREADFPQRERELLQGCGLSELELRAFNAGVEEEEIDLALQGSNEEARDELIEKLLAQADDDLRIELLPGGELTPLAKNLETAYVEQLECTVHVAKQRKTGKERIIFCTAKVPPGRTASEPGAISNRPHAPAGSPRQESPIRSPHDSDDSGFLSPQQLEQQEQEFKDIEAEFHQVKSPEAKKAVVEWMVESPVDEPSSRTERNFRLLQKCWVAWKLWVRQGRSVSTRRIVFRKQWRLFLRKRLDVYFHAWLATTRKHRRWQTIMGRVATRWQQRKVASAFDAWLDYVGWKTRNTRLLDRSVRRLWQSRVAAALSRWQEYHRQQKLKLRATLHWANRFVANFFTRWQQYTRYHKQLREEREAHEEAEAAQQGLRDTLRREKRKVRAEAYRKIYKRQLRKWHFEKMEDCFYAWRRWCIDRVRQKLCDEREEARGLKQKQKEEAAADSAANAAAAVAVTGTSRTSPAGKISSLLHSMTFGLLGQDENVLTASVDDVPAGPSSTNSDFVVDESDSIADASEEDARSTKEHTSPRGSPRSPRKSPKREQRGSPVRRPGRSPVRRASSSNSDDVVLTSLPPPRNRRMTRSRQRRQQQQRGHDSHNTRRRNSGSGNSASPRRSPSRTRTTRGARSRSRSRSRGSLKSNRHSPSIEATTDHFDDELRLIEQDAEEALNEADKTLQELEADKGSSFRRRRTRSSGSPARQKRQEASHGATSSPDRKLVSSDDDRGSSRSPKDRTRSRGEISPRTLPMSPGQHAAAQLLSSPGVKLAKDEMRAQLEIDPERKLRHTRSPSPRRYDENYEEQYAKEMERRLEERLQAAAERREQYAQENGKVRLAGGGEGHLGLSGARGPGPARYSCKACGWTGTSLTAHHRANKRCSAVPVSITSAGKVSPGFGTGSRFGNYSLTSGDAVKGNKFLHETRKDKEDRLLAEAIRGSPQSYTRTLGLS